MRPACVYMMSNKSHRLYVGSTTDLFRRVGQHRRKTYPNGFTARYVFDRLVWFEFLENVSLARAREKAIKGWLRARKVALIQQTNPNWLDLTDKIDPLKIFR